LGRARRPVTCDPLVQPFGHAGQNLVYLYSKTQLLWENMYMTSSISVENETNDIGH
jgi:hypothetical protein